MPTECWKEALRQSATESNSGCSETQIRNKGAGKHGDLPTFARRTVTYQCRPWRGKVVGVSFMMTSWAKLRKTLKTSKLAPRRLGRASWPNRDLTSRVLGSPFGEVVTSRHPRLSKAAGTDEKWRLSCSSLSLFPFHLALRKSHL